MNIRLLFSISLLGCASSVYADQFHYRNFLIGDRAIGLGGAYTGIADDSSGVYYNPAGTAFALSNDLSGSANAIYQSKVKYKHTISDKDFTENSSGSIPSFFGGLQKLDNYVQGLVFAFGIYFDNNLLQDQNDPYHDIKLGRPAPCTSGGVQRAEINLKRFHRTANQRASTSNMSGSLAYRIFPRLAVGIALNYMNVDELVQEYQDVLTESDVCDTNGNPVARSTLKTQNVRQHVVGHGIQPILSMQAILTDRLSLGLTFKFGQYVSQSYQLDSEFRSIQNTPGDQSAIDDAAKEGSGATITNASVSEVNASPRNGNPLGRPPIQIGMGLAYFHSTRLLLSADVSYHGAVNSADKIDQVGKAYQKDAVVNYAAGMEYYLLPSLPIRLGWFTNFDARPKINPKVTSQRDHIDYNGESIFLAWVQPNSQLGAGVILQQGWGEAQKLSGSSVIQKVSAASYTFAFSATHSL